MSGKASRRGMQEMKTCESSKDKIIFLDGFYNEGSHLLLYKGGDERYPVLRSFMEAGIKDNEICVYTFPREPDELKLERHFESHVNQFHQFPLIPGRKKCLNEGHITTFYSKLMELGGHFNSEGYKALRLVVDFGDLLDSANLEVFDYLEENSQRCRENFPISQLYAVDINSADQEILGRLVGLYDRMVMSAGDGSMMYLPKSSLEEPTASYIDVTSRETIEHCVKSSLDVIVLSLLQQEPMCGFDVIKTIVQRFDVRLSQGVVYPLLYSFKEQGYLRTEIKPDNKTKVYTPTEAGEEFIRKQLKAYAIAQKRILDLTVSDIV